MNEKFYFSIFQIAKEIQKIFLINKKKKIEIVSNFTIKKQNKQISRFKYFNNTKILFKKKHFISQLQKMI